MERRLSARAIAAGHEVNAFVRNPARMTIQHPLLQIVPGDVLQDLDAIKLAVAGQDAVIVCLGAGAKGGLRSIGTENIIKAMQQTGVRKLICQSTLGAGESVSELNLKWKLLFWGPLRWAMADHEKQESIVKASGLDWTIVRPAAFTDGPLTGNYKFGCPIDADRLSLTISRADVANFLLDQIETDSFRSQAVSLSC